MTASGVPPAAGRKAEPHVLGAGGVHVDLPNIFSRTPAVIHTKHRNAGEADLSMSVFKVTNQRSLWPLRLRNVLSALLF